MRFVFTNYSTSTKCKNLFYNTFPSKFSTLGFFNAKKLKMHLLSWDKCEERSLRLCC